MDILSVLNILIPILVIFINFFLNNSSTKKLTSQKCYQHDIKIESFNKKVILGRYIIILFITFLINSLCYYYIIKLVTPMITNYILLLIDMICFEVITRVYKKRRIKNNSVVIRLYNSTKLIRVHSLSYMIFVSLLIVIGLEYISGKNLELNYVVGYGYFALAIILLVQILFKSIKFFNNIIEFHDIKVNFKDGSYIKCQEIYEKRNSYVLKNMWSDSISDRSNIVEVGKENINSIAISTRYINLITFYQNIKKI